MNEYSTKILKIIGWMFFGVFFAVSLYFSYQYFDKRSEEKKNEETKNTEIIQKELIGTVNSIDNDRIQIHDNQSQKDYDVKITDKTTFIKTYLDSSDMEQKEENASIGDIKKQTIVKVELENQTNNTDYKAVKVSYQSANYITGTLESIDQNEISIITTPKELLEKDKDIQVSRFKVNLSNGIEFYRINFTIDEASSQAVISKPEKISREDVLQGENMYVFFNGDFILNPNLSAVKIIIQGH